VSSADQDPALQLDALHAAGCARVFTDNASGALARRPQLDAALDYARGGDVLVVWRLDRLGRSLRHLVDLVEDMVAREIGLRSLAEGIGVLRVLDRDPALASVFPGRWVLLGVKGG
jgi:DNA invertase Pin-like site-specific DNA recombinase